MTLEFRTSGTVSALLTSLTKRNRQNGNLNRICDVELLKREDICDFEEFENVANKETMGEISEASQYFSKEETLKKSVSGVFNEDVVGNCLDNSLL
jgi:hypothetical protein